MAQVLSGKEVADDIRNKIRTEVEEIKRNVPNFEPRLAIVQVGGREDSNVYIRMKVKAGSEVGINATHVQLSQNATQHEILSTVERLNDDTSVHGIIVQLPLDCSNPVDENFVTNAISPEKDVDGLHLENAGKLSRGDMENCVVPCTPRGCLELIKRTGVSLSGKKATVIGRSKIVGAPMSDLLRCCNATVTVCHSKTQNIQNECSAADILVVATGKAEMVKGDWIKPGAVVIDCGINSIPDETKKSGKRLVGDVAFGEAKARAAWITPVPGGVGPMTVAMLMRNTLDSAKRLLQRSRALPWSFTALKFGVLPCGFSALHCGSLVHSCRNLIKLLPK